MKIPLLVCCFAATCLAQIPDPAIVDRMMQQAADQVNHPKLAQTPQPVVEIPVERDEVKAENERLIVALNAGTAALQVADQRRNAELDLADTATFIAEDQARGWRIAAVVTWLFVLLVLCYRRWGQAS